MVLLKNSFIKKIVIISFIFIMLTYFSLTPISHASKIQLGEGEFYYAGVTKGQYTPSESLISWLLNKIGEIVDFLLGIMTMGARMVIVGWTALFEILLTKTLEASTGIPMDFSDVDSTSIENNTSSSNNITVEAIVYNQVPILNINLFEIEETKLCTTGTGHYISCDDCGEGLFKKCKMINCDCEKCALTMKEPGHTEKNAVSIIKENVSMWYIILRLIAIAAMLCVLIGIGIKMAITSSSQEKAVYKRMLVDWLVGMILIFSVHYIMIVIIDLNESLVGIIKDVQTGVDELTRKEFRLPAKTNEELEISIYEAVRTRAYDPKLINGMTGTVMYITLVFMAVRFTLMYLKRYLTIIVLTIMAPGAAFSFAIQKALTGKSKAFSNWLREYFMNVIIQTVHALVYTSFVTIALLISLNSISGMIMAFVFMNFMLKADDLFRKIFRMSEGGSLSSDTINDSDPKKLMNSAKSAMGIVAATKFMSKSPLTKAVKAPLKMAGTEAVLGISRYKKNHEDKEGKAQKALEKNRKLEKSLKNIKNLRKEFNELTKSNSSMNKEFKEYLENVYKPEAEVGFDGEDKMDKELLELEKLSEKLKEKHELTTKEIKWLNKLQQERNKFDEATNVSTKDVIKAHIDKFFDYDNYYEKYEPTIEEIREERYRKGIFVKGLSEAENDVLGRESLLERKPYRRKRVNKFDPNKNKWTKQSMSDLVAEQLKSENLLGLSKEDKKLMKESVALVKDSLVGFGSLFVGLGSIVTNPGVGFGLLASGANTSFSVADKLGLLDTSKNIKPVVNEKHKKYSFKRFEKGARQTIVKAAITTAEGEKDKLIVTNVRENHETLYNKLKIGGAGIAVLGGLTIAPLAPVAQLAMGIGTATFVVANKAKKYSGYSQNSLMGRINKQHFKQLKEQKEKMIKDEITMASEDEKNDFESTYKTLALSILTEVEKEANLSKEEVKEIQEQRIELEKEALSTGDAVKTNTGKIIILQEPKVKQEAQIIEEATAEVIINKMLKERIHKNFINEKSVQDEIKKVIETKLIQQGTLPEGEKVEEKIKDLETKIKKTSEKIINESEPIKESTTEGEEVTEKKEEPKVSILEQMMIQQVIKEQLETGKVEDVRELRTDDIVKAIEDKKKKIKGSNIVIDLMRKESLKEQYKGAEEGKDTNKKETLKELMEESVNANFEDKTSQSSIDFIQKTVTQIKRANKVVPLTEEDRRKEKLKRIQALDRILINEAEQEIVPNRFDDSEEIPLEEQITKKTTDEIIQELFENTSQQELAYELLGTVNNLKRLNVRGELNKMKGKSGRYKQAKLQIDVDNLREKYSTGIVSNADREYTGGDGNRRLEGQVATYGPVTDIISLIKQQHKVEK